MFWASSCVETIVLLIIPIITTATSILVFGCWKEKHSGKWVPIFYWLSLSRCTVFLYWCPKLLEPVQDLNFRLPFKPMQGVGKVWTSGVASSNALLRHCLRCFLICQNLEGGFEHAPSLSLLAPYPNQIFLKEKMERFYQFSVLKNDFWGFWQSCSWFWKSGNDM